MRDAELVNNLEVGRVVCVPAAFFAWLVPKKCNFQWQKACRKGIPYNIEMNITP
jgi:hypothetical protein